MTTNRVYMETDRLIIRDHIASDLEGLGSLIRNADNMKYLMDIYAKDQNAVKENLMTAMDAITLPFRDKYFFAIIEKASGSYVGEIGFTIVDSALAEMGYFIKRNYWNRGFVTEAGKVVLNFAFHTLGLHKITIGCVKENVGSERVMIKLGFTKEGELLEHQLIGDEWKDRVIYGYLKKNYLMKPTEIASL